MTKNRNQGKNKDSNKKDVEASKKVEKPQFPPKAGKHKIRTGPPQGVDYTPKPRKPQGPDCNEIRFRIKNSQPFWREMIAGKLGFYHVGIDNKHQLEAHKFEVRMHLGNEGEFLVVEGDIDGIFIPHGWLFIPSDKCRIQNGYVGRVQLEMMRFLKQALRNEIYEESARRDQMGITTTANKEPPEGLQVTAEVINMDLRREQRLIREAECNLLKMLQGTPGLYNLSEGDSTCIVRLAKKTTGPYIAFEFISGNHPIAKMGNRYEAGTIIYISTMERHHEGLAAWIKNKIFQIHGLRINSFRSDPKRHVNPELSGTNVDQVTQLA